MTASAAGRTATTEVWVDYSQYYLTDADEDGQARGRLPAGPGGMLAVGPSLVVLYSGTHLGPVRVTVQVHQAAPPLEQAAWEDVAEASFTAPDGQVMLEEWGGRVHQELPNLTPAGTGTYRLRLHVRGRDRGWEEDTPEIPVEEHLLAVWPAAPAVGVVHKLTSREGQAAAARAAQAPELPATPAKPAFQPPPAAAPPGPMVTTAFNMVDGAPVPPEPPGRPDDQPPQQPPAAQR